MNFLLLNFDSDKKSFIKRLIKNRSSKELKFFNASNTEKAKNSNDWEQIEFILCYVKNTKDCFSDSIKQTVYSIPTLFITHSDLEVSNFTKLDVQSNILPENEITSYILNKLISDTIDKFQMRKKLKEVKSIQKELVAKEAKYRDLFENSTIGMYEIDENGNFILANQVLLDILGLNKFSDLDKLNAFEKGISTNGTRQKLKKILLKNDKVDSFEDEWIKADNTKIFVKENIRAQKDEYGNIKNYQGVVQDITESKTIETELVKSKKDAEKSDKLKSEFLTQISHEIRTPVNTLLSFATLIKDDLSSSLSNDLIDSFDHMDKAGKRIIRTIDLLVKMSELHTDNYEPDFRKYNLFDVLEELYHLYLPIAEKKGLSIQFVKAIDSANILFDKSTMFDVFSNIIDNAIKYTMEGSVKIYVKKSTANKVTVTIVDTGIGISEEYIKNIFIPFSQETTGYTRQFDGNGLGLALVQEYCSLNNANIFVSSEKNNGSNFTVMFN